MNIKINLAKKELLLKPAVSLALPIKIQELVFTPDPMMLIPLLINFSIKSYWNITVINLKISMFLI
tara:strand:- start:871 stop:1068 length:198 start_codon:yes stop_codon:yes gene_type:complete